MLTSQPRGHHFQVGVDGHMVIASLRLCSLRVSFVGRMPMGNIAPRAGIEPTSLAFLASELTITPPRLPDVTTLHMSACSRGTLPERSVQTTTVSMHV